MSITTAESRAESVLTYTTLKDHIREDIINGRLPPGERLKFGSLAKRFGTSTMPVRQALQDLQAEGLVVFLPNRGASVRRIDENLAESLYDVRKALMGLVMERCILYITNSDLMALEHMEREIEKAETVEMVVEASGAFYGRIFQIARNEFAMEVLTNMWPLILTLRRYYGLRNQKGVYENNKALLEALKNRDTNEAVRIAQKSCDESKFDLISRLRQVSAREPRE